jgi:hypothetical protein
MGLNIKIIPLKIFLYLFSINLHEILNEHCSKLVLAVTHAHLPNTRFCLF